MGTVPAMLDADFVHATFRSVPALIGRDWASVSHQIDSVANNSTLLQSMSRDAALFYEELHPCMMQDMDTILRGVFADKASSPPMKEGNVKIAKPPMAASPKPEMKFRWDSGAAMRARSKRRKNRLQ